MGNKGVIAGLLWIGFWVTFWVGGTIGWIINIVKIVHHLSEPLTAMMVFRMVGIIVAPLGAILGFF